VVLKQKQKKIGGRSSFGATIFGVPKKGLKVAAQASNTKKVAADRNLENIFAAD
jgi:hypothetical protein